MFLAHERKIAVCYEWTLMAYCKSKIQPKWRNGLVQSGHHRYLDNMLPCSHNDINSRQHVTLFSQ
jgi:hypothetical protein